MVTQFESHGFDDLRLYVENNWDFIALVDDQGNELLRWQVPDNANTTWDSTSSSNPLRAKLTVTGQDIQDAGNTLPVTVDLTESYKSASATTRTTYDPFTNISIEVPNDKVVITHEFRLPP